MLSWADGPFGPGHATEWAARAPGPPGLALAAAGRPLWTFEHNFVYW